MNIHIGTAILLPNENHEEYPTFSSAALCKSPIANVSQGNGLRVELNMKSICHSWVTIWKHTCVPDLASLAMRDCKDIHTSIFVHICMLLGSDHSFQHFDISLLRVFK